METDQKKAADLFAAALDLEPGPRAGFLAGHCAGNPSLLADVNSLLYFAEQAENLAFMKEPALEVSALQVVADGARQDLAGQLFDRYEILSLIGEGGMGTVYLARDTDLNREVALKIIRGNLATKETLRRFHNERLILANLKHSNIAQLLDVSSTADGLPFLVMEYVEGVSLNRYADDRELSISERLKLFRAVCSAVSYAHQNLVIHRDIKPSNILVTAAGEPKLLDFGIAKILQASGSLEPDVTATMFQVMTPAYASPEQVKGESITTATDVYSLGVLLYELLTARHPYKLKRRTSREVCEAVCQQQPERPSLAIARIEEPSETQPAIAERVSQTRGSDPHHLSRSLRGDLDNIILKALQKEPQRRYASVGEFSEDIRRHLEGLPVSARKDTIRYRTSKFIRRNKIGVAVAACILTILMGGIIATAWEARVARAQEAKTARRFNEVRKLAHSVLFDYHDAIANLSGSTPVRERLVKDALEYLDSLAHEASGDVSLQRELATAYIRVGDVQGRPYRSNLGQTAGALISYRKALAILEPISNAEPSNLESRRDLATAYERIGAIQSRGGDAVEAFEKTNKALIMREELLAKDPSNVNYRRELADSYIYFGDTVTNASPSVSERESESKALENQRKALAIRADLAGKDPGDVQLRRDLAEAYTRVGFGLSNIDADQNARKENLEQALQSQLRGLELREELARANPDSALDRRNLGDQYMLTSDAQVRTGDLTGALDGYRKALIIFKELSAADPSNAEAQLDLSFVLIKLAEDENKSGNRPAAHEHYQEALVTLDRLLLNDPNDTEVISALLAVHSAISDESDRAGNINAAIESYSNAVVVSEKLATLKRSQSARAALAVAYSRMAGLHVKAAGSGSAAQRREHWRAGRDWYRKSLEIWEDMRNKGTLGGAHASKPDEVAKEIAKCDAALAK